MKEKTGRPISPGVITGVLEEDLERRTIHIPYNFIVTRMLATAAQIDCGKYGRTTYGRCKYCNRYGIYGSDNYGSCKYY